MAHRIQEKVKQPAIMTGGKLKEYQVKKKSRRCIGIRFSILNQSIDQGFTMDGITL
jgi:hypothetical protein